MPIFSRLVVAFLLCAAASLSVRADSRRVRKGATEALTGQGRKARRIIGMLDSLVVRVVGRNPLPMAASPVAFVPM